MQVEPDRKLITTVPSRSADAWSVSSNKGAPLKGIHPRWYLVRTKQHKETLVHNILLNKIPDSYLPYLLARRDSRGNTREKIVPLFPCYVFARFDLEAQYHGVQRTPGVNGVICVGGEPSQVDDNVIDEIKHRGRNGVIEIARSILRPGDSVNVRSGPLRGLTAVFERYLSGPERAELLINFIGSAGVKLILPTALVERVVSNA